MNIDLPIDVAKNALQQFLATDTCPIVTGQLQKTISTYGNPSSIHVGVDDLGIDGLSVVYVEAQKIGNRSLMMQVSSFKNILEFPFSAKVGNLKSLIVGMKAFIIQNSIDGWLYHKEKDGVFLPWFVRSITFEPGKMHQPPLVIIRLSANTAKTTDSRQERDNTSSSISFGSDDIVKKSIPELLAKNDYFHETPELKAGYESDLARFAQYRTSFGNQFTVNGQALIDEGYSQRKLITLSANSKMVNDEEQITRTILEEIDAPFWENDKGETLFNKQPYHCRLFMFHLSLHENVWVHVSFVTPYVYRPELRDKLILPALHRDLIDILTEDMDVIMEDFVDGKSGGTTILCKGRPGLGKTLAAEVYAEVIGKPLYRVHSGQLGTDAMSVEEMLTTVLNRAARWGAVLLLDEADVFVRRRDDDIQHNAVVASFLRTMEYFNGLMFMTTNREDDIDDAILSRCIAIIKFEHPTTDDAKKIWRVMADQFGIDLPDDMINKLVQQFDKASGRDIKELLKLTSKFSRRKGVPLDTEAFRQCAIFRGVL